MVDWYYDESGKGATALEVTLELVEQLRQHANVSFADAKAALEHTDGDLLEALIWLEQQGKIDLAGVGSYHTGPDAPNPRQAPPRATSGLKFPWRCSSPWCSLRSMWWSSP